MWPHLLGPLYLMVALKYYYLIITFLHRLISRRLILSNTTDTTHVNTHAIIYVDRSHTDTNLASRKRDLKIMTASQVLCLSCIWMELNLRWMMLTMRSISLGEMGRVRDCSLNRFMTWVVNSLHACGGHSFYSEWGCRCKMHYAKLNYSEVFRTCCWDSTATLINIFWIYNSSITSSLKLQKHPRDWPSF